LTRFLQSVPSTSLRGSSGDEKFVMAASATVIHSCTASAMRIVIEYFEMRTCLSIISERQTGVANSVQTEPINERISTI
jgi:hypothetical protein